MSLEMQTSFGTVYKKSLDHYFGKNSTHDSASCISHKNSKKGDEFSQSLSTQNSASYILHTNSKKGNEFSQSLSQSFVCVEQHCDESEEEIDFGGYPSQKISTSATTYEDSEEMDFGGYPTTKFSSLAIASQIQNEINFGYSSKKYASKPQESEEIDFGSYPTQNHQPLLRPYKEAEEIEFWHPSQESLRLDESYKVSNETYYEEKPIETPLSSEVPYDEDIDYINIDIDFDFSTNSSASKRQNISDSRLIKSSDISEVIGKSQEQRRMNSSSNNAAVFSSKKMTQESLQDIKSSLSRDESLILFSSQENESKMGKSFIPGTAGSYSARVQKKIDNLVKLNKLSNCIGDQSGSSDKSVISPTPDAFKRPRLILNNSGFSPNKTRNEKKYLKEPVKSKVKTSKTILYNSDNEKSLDGSLIPGTASSYPDRLRKKIDKLLKIHKQSKQDKNLSDNSDSSEIPLTPEVCKRLNYNSGYTVIAKSKKVRNKDLQLAKSSNDAVSQVILHNSGSQKKLIRSLIPGTLNSYSDRIQKKIDKLMKLNKKSKFINYLLESSGGSKIAQTPRVCRQLSFSFSDSAAGVNKKSKKVEKSLPSGRSTPSKDATSRIVLHYTESEDLLDKSVIPGTNSSYSEKLQKKIDKLVNNYKRSKN